MKRVNPENIAYAGVYRRKDAKGVSTLYINYRDNGKVKWVRIGTEPKFNPEIARDVREVRMQEQRPDAEPSDLTMDEAFQEFSTTYTNIQQLHDTDTVLSRYTKHIKPTFGNMKLKDITTVMINRQKVHWIKVVSLSTVQQIISLMSRIYNAMGSNGLGLFHGPNPVALARKIQIENSRLRFLTKAEGKNLMDVLKGIDIRTYRQCAFCLYAGLRKMEAVTIRGANIDLENSILTIRTKDKKQGRMASLPILPKLRSIIEDIYAEKYYAPNERLFPSDKFNYKAFAKAVGACDLNKDINWEDKDLQGGRFKVVLHTLRHTFASNLVGSGVPMEVVRRLMRHSSIATTERYSHVNDAQLKDAIETLNASWNEAINAD